VYDVKLYRILFKLMKQQTVYSCQQGFGGVRPDMNILAPITVWGIYFWDFFHKEKISLWK